ncbi:hypothetical protein LTR53_005318 [Teratosphaeriaceae sp. CCFEE 6253]|nr:hypothetical protein LTR53_005318 [Teratosphaeriaceae sp. CCFEE 6253]
MHKYNVSSAAGSFDLDLERATRTSSPLDRGDTSRGNGAHPSWRNSHSRPRSRNYSRPSPPNSVDHAIRRRRSSDDIAHTRRVNTSTELPASPAGTRVPVFAQKAVVQSAMLHRPPPIPPDSPVLQPRHSRKSLRSLDVVEAARTADCASTRSLVSVIREKAELESSTFAQRVFGAGKDDLLYDHRTTQRLKDHRHGILDLTTLQRMSQHVLQQKLVEQVKAVGDKGAWMEIGIRETLHEYCKVVRDLEYMEQRGRSGKPTDPFLLTTANPLSRQLLEEVGLVWADPAPPPGPPDTLARTQRQSRVKQALRRLLLSLLGGLAVLAPFLVMFLIPGQLVRLVCACVFTVAFGVVVAAVGMPDRTGLLATAAYAAALVLFVGTNAPTWQYG